MSTRASAEPPPPETFTTPRLLMRRPRATDADAIYEEYASDPEVTRYVSWRTHERRADADSFLEFCRKAWESGDELNWAITRKGDDRVIGMTGLRMRGHRVELGYVLGRKHWRQGLAPEAAGAVMVWGASLPAVHRVWGVCDVENRASSRVLEKLGMTREAVLHRWVVMPAAAPCRATSTCTRVCADAR